MVQQIKLPHPEKPIGEQDLDVLLALVLFSKCKNESKEVKLEVAKGMKERFKDIKDFCITTLCKKARLSDFMPLRYHEPKEWDECYLVIKNIFGDGNPT